MEIHYDLDGCHGTLACTERTNRPSWLVWLVLLAASGWALFVVSGATLAQFAEMLGTREQDLLFAVFPCLMPLPLVGVAIMASIPANANLLFARSRVERSFRVERHLLTFDSQDGERTIDLRNAEIRGSDSGVFVAPVFGESLELYWDDADLQQAERLAEALRNVQERDTGDLSEVPSELHQARRTERV